MSVYFFYTLIRGDVTSKNFKTKMKVATPFCLEANMYNNSYMNNYQQNIAQQSLNERIDNEIERLKQMKTNMQQPIQPITQNFQFAPANNGIKLVNSVDDVKKELTIMETPFVNSDYSTLWIKNAKGDIRTFALEEILPKDDKDILIEQLRQEIKHLKENKVYEYEQYNEQCDVDSNENADEQSSEQFDEPVKSKTTSNVSNARTSKTRAR